MGHYEAPYSEQKNGDQLRERANHCVTGRGGGHDIDLQRFALEGMHVYGPLVGVAGGKARFTPKLSEYLDAADDVYRGMRDCGLLAT